MKNILGKLLIMVSVILLLAACGQNGGEKPDSATDGQKVLKMATSADYPPFESRTPNGEFEGFDIDLAKAIADELNCILEIEDMKFDGLIGALQSGRADMVLAGMNADVERKKNVAFSTEYLPANSAFVTTKDKAIEDLEGLEGKIVGVQLGSIQAEGAQKLTEQYDFEVKQVDDAAILIQELLSKRIDVAYIDKDVAEGFIKEQNLVGFADPSSSAPGYAIAFPKDSEIVDDINKALETLESNGKLQELKNKWELN